MTQETPGAVTPSVLARAAGAAPQAGPQVAPQAGPQVAPQVGPEAGAADPEAAVRDALGLLDGLEDVPPADHVARFEAVHDALRAQLSGDSGR